MFAFLEAVRFALLLDSAIRQALLGLPRFEPPWVAWAWAFFAVADSLGAHLGARAKAHRYFCVARACFGWGASFLPALALVARLSFDYYY